MRVFVPIDGSKCSFRALEFATEFTARFERSLHVMHITDYDGEAKQDLLDRAKTMLAEAGIEDDPEIIPITQMAAPRYANPDFDSGPTNPGSQWQPEWSIAVMDIESFCPCSTNPQL